MSPNSFRRDVRPTIIRFRRQAHHGYGGTKRLVAIPYKD